MLAPGVYHGESSSDRHVSVSPSLDEIVFHASGQVAGRRILDFAPDRNPIIRSLALNTMHPSLEVSDTIPSPMSSGPGIGREPSTHHLSAPQIPHPRVHGPSYVMALPEVPGTNSSFHPFLPAVRPPIPA